MLEERHPLPNKTPSHSPYFQCSQGCELVVGNVNGELLVYKGQDSKPWRRALDLGMVSDVFCGSIVFFYCVRHKQRSLNFLNLLFIQITCVEIGDVFNHGIVSTYWLVNVQKGVQENKYCIHNIHYSSRFLAQTLPER